MNSPLAKALAGLYARVPMGMRLGLAAMAEACERWDHPERSFEVIHVAGTNGKGSVSAMTESIARASGYRTGLYTSPHLCRFAERIRINREPIDDDRLANLLARILEKETDLSFFECATLAAFVAFREAKTELAIIEVGLGGRYDATNVIPPARVSAITSIALDHTDRLGSTLTAIAGEKGGIIKAGSPVVLSSAITGDAREALLKIARKTGSYVIDAAPHDSPGLAGAHQRFNAGTAAAITHRLGIAPQVIDEGLAKTTWPGRLERIGPYLLDAAHNPEGAHALAAYVESMSETGPRALVFGAMADKAWPEMIDALAPLATARFYATPQGRKAAPLNELHARHAGIASESIPRALEAALDAVGPHGLVIVAGSIYLLGEARATLLNLPMDPVVAL